MLYLYYSKCCFFVVVFFVVFFFNFEKNFRYLTLQIFQLTRCSPGLTQQYVDRIINFAHLFCELCVVEGIRVVANVQYQIVQLP